MQGFSDLLSNSFADVHLVWNLGVFDVLEEADETLDWVILFLPVPALVFLPVEG